MPNSEHQFIQADNHIEAAFPFDTAWLIGKDFFKGASFSRNA